MTQPYWIGRVWTSGFWCDSQSAKNFVSRNIRVGFVLQQLLKESHLLNGHAGASRKSYTLSQIHPID